MSRNLTYYETGLRAINIQTSSNPLLSFVLGMNDNVQITERTALTILDALSSVGGLFQAMIIIIKYIIGKFQDQLFY